MTTRILIDCDPGLDDAIAILLAVASPELELLGVTTVAGNTTLDNATRNALTVLELGGRPDVPVAAGAAAPLVRPLRTSPKVHGDTGLAGPDLPAPASRALGLDAVDFLAGRIGPGVVLCPIGPLTNVAHLLERHPEARPARIVLMGGAIGLGNVTPAAEFNIWSDPDAADRVFRSGIPITMVGLDVTYQALTTPAHVERLRRSGKVGSVVAQMLDFYGGAYRESHGWEGAPIHDAVVIGHLIDRGLLHTVHRHVAVETVSDLCRGRTVVDLMEKMGEAPNVDVAVGIDADRFLDLLVERVGSLI